MAEQKKGPYCGNCGYDFTGLTESSKCPECGKPIVEVLQRPEWKHQVRSRRYRSPLVVWGLPLLDIAYGPDENSRFGRARGIIALGDTAAGILAIGGRAVGVIAGGGVACGIFALGGVAIGLFSAAGMAIGLLMAFGGGAIGGISSGGAAIGCVAEGGGAIGYYARGGGVVAKHGISAAGRDPEAVQFFQDYQWLLGGNLGGIGGFNITLLAWWFIALMLVGVVVGVPLFFAYLTAVRKSEAR